MNPNPRNLRHFLILFLLDNKETTCASVYKKYCGLHSEMEVQHKYRRKKNNIMSLKYYFPCPVLKC